MPALDLQRLEAGRGAGIVRIEREHAPVGALRGIERIAATRGFGQREVTLDREIPLPVVIGAVFPVAGVRLGRLLQSCQPLFDVSGFDQIAAFHEGRVRGGAAGDGQRCEQRPDISCHWRFLISAPGSEGSAWFLTVGG
ncbi:hypothetical protein D3C83_26180 [compost metagenome]